MKTTIRRLTCLLLALCLLLPMTACGSGKFKDDVPAAQVCHTVTDSLSGKDGWHPVSDDYISPSSWGEDYADYLTKVSEYRIMVSENSDMNIDEVGVFLCNSTKDAQKVRAFAESYLQAKVLQLKPLLESYNTSELPKLDYVKTVVCGRYVLYTILSSADTTAAQTAFEQALTVE